MTSVPAKMIAHPAPIPFGRHGSAAVARAKLEELRGVLAERFPERRRQTEAVFSTGFAPLDEAGEGGALRGAISEVVASAPSCGGQWLVRSMLKAARRTHQYLALVDGSDGFDPQSEEEGLLPYLLWVRCRTVAQALQATDLLVRDGNLSLVLADFRGNRAEEIRRQPIRVWFRLQRAVEQSGGILVVLGGRPWVNSAAVRVDLGGEERRGVAIEQV